MILPDPPRPSPGDLLTALRAQGCARAAQTYAGRILGEWRVNHPTPTKARRKGSR